MANISACSELAHPIHRVPTSGQAQCKYLLKKITYKWAYIAQTHVVQGQLDKHERIIPQATPWQQI